MKSRVFFFVMWAVVLWVAFTFWIQDRRAGIEVREKFEKLYQEELDGPSR